MQKRQATYEEMCQILWDNEDVNRVSELFRYLDKHGYTHADKGDVQTAFGWIKQFPSVVETRKVWYPIWAN